jgi:hypothetical protein
MMGGMGGPGESGPGGGGGGDHGGIGSQGHRAGFPLVQVVWRHKFGGLGPGSNLSK